MTQPPRVTVGVSLKMYCGHAEALDWLDRVAELACEHPTPPSRRGARRTG